MSVSVGCTIAPKFEQLLADNNSIKQLQLINLPSLSILLFLPFLTAESISSMNLQFISFSFSYLNDSIKFITMLAGSASTALPPPSNKLKTLGCWLIILLLIAIGLVVAVFRVGSQQAHQGNKHLLYDAFDESPEHAELLEKLAKSKLSIVVGKKQDGIFNFIQHFANKLSLQDKTVFVQDFNEDDFVIYQYAKQAKVQIDELLGLQQEDGDWILKSLNGEIIPQKVIDKIRKENPKAKIVIVTTSRKQRNTGFKQFEYPEMEEHQIQESIQRNFKVSQNTADILYDYFETPENIFEKLDIQEFDHETLLGENYRTLEGLDKQDNRILKDLCKKGEGNSDGQRPNLSNLGVIFYEGDHYWVNAASRLNYELHKNLNCKNKIIPEDVLAEIEELKERQEEQKREKEEEERQRQEEERQAQEQAESAKPQKKQKTKSKKSK